MSADEVLDRARSYFDGRFGLTLGNYNPQCCMEFTGESGFVDIAVEGLDGKLQVIVRTREWEYQIKDFLGSFK